MRRLLIPICVIIVLAVIALIPVRQTYKLNINSSYFNVYQNLATPQNWAKWYPAFKGNRGSITGSDVHGFNLRNPSTNVALQKTGLGAFNLNISGSNNVGFYDCVVIANDTVKGTDVILSHRFKLLGYIWSNLRSDKKETFIYNLKNYLEDTRQYYGFLITRQVDNEKLLMVKRQTSFNDNLCRDNQAMLQQLFNLSSKAKLNITGPVQLQYLSSAKDSTEVIMGLPVKQKKSTDPEIQYMAAPSGKVLVGYFKGKYKGRHKLYTAMSLYLADHYLHAQTRPLEKFVGNRLPGDEDSVVDLQIMIPYV